MASVTSFFENVPQSVQWALAGIGALYLGSKFFGYLQLVLSSFLLPGTNVRASPSYCLRRGIGIGSYCC